MKFGHRILEEMQGHEDPGSFFEYKAVKKSIKRLGQCMPDAAQRVEALTAVLEVIKAQVHKVNECTQQVRAELDWIDGTLCISEDPGFGKLSEFTALNSTALRKAVKKLDKQLTPAERAGMMRARFDPLALTDPTRTSRGEASVGGVVRALADPELRAKLPFEPLGHGANAKVWLASLGLVQGVLGGGAGGEPGRSSAVGAARLAIKDGVWRSEADFNTEVTVQERAASVGVAPQVYFWRWLGRGDAGGYGRGVIGMARLSQPSFFQWLRWLTVQKRREAAAAAALNPRNVWKSIAAAPKSFAPAEDWLIDPAVLKLPLVARWRREVRRLQAELRRLNIAHGDVHDMNFVFHVVGEDGDAHAGRDAEAAGAADAEIGVIASAAAASAAPKLLVREPAAASSGVAARPTTSAAGSSSAPSDELADLLRSKRRKYRLMDAIAQGPGGPASLYVIDFGSARMIKGRVAWLLHDLVGGGYRMADASKLKLSPATPDNLL
jgi:hypothetical protein